MATGDRRQPQRKPGDVDLAQVDIRLRQAEREIDSHEERLNNHLERLGDSETAIAEARDAVAGLKKAHRSLNQLVMQMGERIKRAAEKDEQDAEPVFCWLTAEPEAAIAKIDELKYWLIEVYAVFVREPLTDCWLRHPDVVERLLVLRDAWIVAYADGASPTLRLDWLHRHLPPTKDAIKAEIGTCGLRGHVNEHPADFQPRELAGIDDHAEVIEWWTGTRGMRPEPAPTQDALREAEARKQAARQQANRPNY